MKILILIWTGIIFSGSVFSQSGTQKNTKPDPDKPIQIVEAACGKCQFGLKNRKECELFVRIDGKAYMVEGTSIDDHGDAHEKDGFCSVIRKAEVQGEIKNNRFKATYFRLIDSKEEKNIQN
jgi:hypothetical protein